MSPWMREKVWNTLGLESSPRITGNPPRSQLSMYCWRTYLRCRKGAVVVCGGIDDKGSEYSSALK